MKEFFEVSFHLQKLLNLDLYEKAFFSSKYVLIDRTIW